MSKLSRFAAKLRTPQRATAGVDEPDGKRTGDVQPQCAVQGCESTARVRALCRSCDEMRALLATRDPRRVEAPVRAVQTSLRTLILRHAGEPAGSPWLAAAGWSLHPCARSICRNEAEDGCLTCSLRCWRSLAGKIQKQPLVSVEGVTLPESLWRQIFAIPASTFSSRRKKKGMDPLTALLTPIKASMARPR